MQTVRLERAAVSGVVCLPTDNSKFIPDLHDIEDSSHTFFIFLIFIYTVVSVTTYFALGFFHSFIVPSARKLLHF